MSFTHFFQPGPTRLVVFAVALMLFLRPGASYGQSLPTAYDIPGQFADLKHHGEALGYHHGEFRRRIDHAPCRNHQGIGRVNGPDGMPYLVLTRNGNGEACPIQKRYDTDGEIHIVRMASRGRDGERLRSNRLALGRKTENTAPPPEDRMVKRIHLSGTEEWPGYKRAGGFQIVDDVLVLAVNKPKKGGQPKGGIVLADLANPEEPEFVRMIALPRGETWAGAFRLREGSGESPWYIATGNSGGERITFRKLDGELWDPDSKVVSEELWKAEYDSLKNDYSQFSNANFVRDALTGNTYMIGMRSTSASKTGGKHYMDLFRVYRRDGRFHLQLVQKRLAINDNAEHVGLLAKLNAGAGIYVSPSGQLMLYSVEHNSDGPTVRRNGQNITSVRMGEFRTSNLSWDRRAHAGLFTVELYNEKRGWLRDGDTQRSLVFDAVDQLKEDLRDLRRHDEFANKAQSIKYLLPAGTSFTVYKDPNPGPRTRSKKFTGDGRVVEIPDLKNVKWDNGSGNLSNSIAAISFDFESPIEVPLRVGATVEDLNSAVKTASGRPGSSIYMPDDEQNLYLDAPLITGLLRPGQCAEFEPSGDLDGDGRTDVFGVRDDGNAWQYRLSSGGTSKWRVLGRGDHDLRDVRFGDFDGDKTTDLFWVKAMNVPENGTEYWGYFSSAGKLTERRLGKHFLPIEKLRLGDFDGDGRTDVFTVKVERNGIRGWHFSSAGRYAWRRLAYSYLPIEELRFGDFDGDGRTDVFSVSRRRAGLWNWRYSSGGASSWRNLNYSNRPLDLLRFGDFDGDGKTDVFSVYVERNRLMWKFSSGGAKGWRNLNYTGL